MALFKNAECPVCKRVFEEGDDVVYCPDCGTPHHRECYNYVGHCVNQGLHKSGYSFYDEYEKKNAEPEAPQIAEIGTFFTPKTQSGASEAPADGEINDEKTDRAGSFPFGSISDYFSDYERDTDRIDGESVADVAATVRTNTKRFITKFKGFEKQNQKLSWNWGAFVFGPYYLFFRKMYKQGILFLCLSTAVDYLFSYLTGMLAPKATKVLMETAEAASAYNFSAFTERSNALSSASDYSTFLALNAAGIAALILVRIIIGIFADYMYKGTVTGIVKRVKDRLDDGATFGASPFANPEGLAFTQEQMKRMYLSRKGGTTIFAPAVAMLALNLITTLL